MDLVFGFKIEDRDGQVTVISYETIYEPSATAYRTLYGADSLAENHKVWASSLAGAASKQ
jgi:hypothetical protein